MPWTAAAIIGSGYLQGQSAKNAANTSAQAQLQAAQIAADAAKFRPVGVTSRYGTSQFTTDAQGNLTVQDTTYLLNTKPIKIKSLVYLGNNFNKV